LVAERRLLTVRQLCRGRSVQCWPTFAAWNQGDFVAAPRTVSEDKTCCC
jgi:hypothetical protein